MRIKKILIVICQTSVLKQNKSKDFCPFFVNTKYLFSMTNKYFPCVQDIMVSRLLERGNFDDKEEAIKKRCETFQNECRPVLEKYADILVKV